MNLKHLEDYVRKYRATTEGLNGAHGITDQLRVGFKVPALSALCADVAVYSDEKHLAPNEARLVTYVRDEVVYAPVQHVPTVTRPKYSKYKARVESDRHFLRDRPHLYLGTADGAPCWLHTGSRYMHRRKQGQDLCNYFNAARAVK